MMTADDFHAHLDRCPQCAHNPFAMCTVGQGLLIAAATGVAPAPPPSSLRVGSPVTYQEATEWQRLVRADVEQGKRIAAQMEVIAMLRNTLEWLDRTGGLSSSVHDRIRNVLVLTTVIP